MKMIKVIIIVFLAIILNGCEKNKSDMTIVDIVMDISYINTNGTDLLDSLSEEAFDTDLIKIYHVTDETKTLFYQDHLTSQKGYFVYKEEGFHDKYFIKITAPNDEDNGSEENPYETTTLIELDTNIIDTINCRVKKGDNSLVCKQIKYNSNIVWDWDDNVERRFTIVK